MTLTTIILVIVLIVSFSILCWMYFNKKLIKKDIIYHPSNYFTWTLEEKNLLEEINKYRKKEGRERLSADDNMLVFARSRVGFWIRNNYTRDDNFHKNLLGQRLMYMDMGLDNVSENVSFEYKNVLEAWKKSDSHNRNMLMNWKYAGVGIDYNLQGDKYVSLILAR